MFVFSAAALLASLDPTAMTTAEIDGRLEDFFRWGRAGLMHRPQHLLCGDGERILQNMGAQSEYRILEHTYEGLGGTLPEEQIIVEAHHNDCPPDRENTGKPWSDAMANIERAFADARLLLAEKGKRMNQAEAD